MTEKSPSFNGLDLENPTEPDLTGRTVEEKLAMVRKHIEDLNGQVERSGNIWTHQDRRLLEGLQLEQQELEKMQLSGE